MKNKFIKTKNIISSGAPPAGRAGRKKVPSEAKVLILFSFVFLLFISLILTNFTKADTTTTTTTCPPGTYYFETGVPFFAKQGECKPFSGFQNMISSLIKKLFPIAGILAFVMIVWAGFEYATSGGDTNKQKNAQDRIANAIIGLILLFAFWIIIYTINPDILKTQNLELTPTNISNNAEVPEELKPDKYLQEQKDILNKLKAAANIFSSGTTELTPDDYEKIIDPSKRPIVDKRNYIPTQLYIEALKKYNILVNPASSPNHGASCDYYIAAVMKTSGLDPSYPNTLSRQYPSILDNPLFKCISGTKGQYLQSNQAQNGSILFYDTDGDDEVEHTALWIDGHRLQASDGQHYPMDRGPAFNGTDFQVLTICQYIG